MATSVRISFGLFDTTALPDSTPSCPDAQPFCDLTNLKQEMPAIIPKAATLEESFFLLDGGLEPFPDAPKGLPWGFWSSEMSGADGVFAAFPVLTLSFSEPHESLGLTLHFAPGGGDFCSDLRVVWQDQLGRVLLGRDFTPDSTAVFLDGKVEDFYKIILTFRRTARPYRYLKLSGIEYGLEKRLGEDEIITASILEEMDPTSAELAVNTLEFTLHSNDADFSLLNPQGAFSVLQQRQKLAVTEFVDGVEIHMGTYYLDSWENGNENSVTLSAVDLVGMIDQTSFAGGMYENVPAGTLVKEVLTSANAAYTLDASLAAQPLSGYLPICSHREALQQIVFALGAVADCSRSDKIKLYPASQRPSSHIGYERKFAGGTVKQLALVTGAEVLAHRYLPDVETRELASDVLEPGEYTISFDSPAHSLAITGGVLQSSGVNRAVVRVNSTGAVVLTGQGYADTRRVFSKCAPFLPANVAPNIAKVEDATLVSASNAETVAGRLYGYYQQRYSAEFRMVVGSEVNGDCVIVDSLRGERIRGTIESLSIDLTGGFIGSVRVVGVRIPTINGYLAGELKVGEEMGVL